MENLLSYQGNAGLGIGSNPGIPVPGEADFRQINQAARDIMLQDNHWNLVKYQQKIRDRDSFRDLVDQGQVAQGEILPEYQSTFDNAQKRVTDFYQANGDKLLSDPSTYQKYVGLVRDLKDVSTHAQVNTRQVRALEQDKANAALPVDQENIQKHIDAQKASTTSKFWNQVNPYQKMHDMAMSDVLAVPAAKKTSYVDPKDPFGSYDTTTVDYNDILRLKQNQFLNDKTGEAADSISQFYNKMQDYDPIELGKTLSSVDNQIARYNKDRGFTKNTPGYVDPVKRAIVGGRLIIQEPQADFAAKYALAQQPAFVTRENKFNKDVGTYVNAERKIDADAAYKRIMAANAGARTEAYNARTKAFVDNLKSQIAARKKPEDQAQFMDEMYDRNLLNQNSLIKPAVNNKTGNKNLVQFNEIPVESSLPVLTFGKDNKIVPLEGIGSDDRTGKGGHYLPIYKVDGKTKPLSYFSDNYIQFKQRLKDAGKSDKWNGSLDDYIRLQIDQGKADFIIKGKNGVVDRNLSRSIQQAISNKDTGKGETPIFAAPEDAPPEDAQIPETPPQPEQ